MGYASDFVRVLLSQRGDPYHWGEEVRMDDPNPPAFDCSEFTEWGSHRVGNPLPDGSANQYEFCRRKGTLITVTKALATPGALLYHPGHVAVSMGDKSHSVEAKGKAYGVGIFSALGRGWTTGMLVPGMIYAAPPKPPGATHPRWPGRFITQPPVMKMTAAETRFQQRLADLGFYHGRIDGIYGPATEAATVALQDRAKIRQDGIVGEITWNAAWTVKV